MRFISIFEVGAKYKLTQYVIKDRGVLKVHKFDCDYRAVLREDLKKLLIANGCRGTVGSFGRDWILSAYICRNKIEPKKDVDIFIYNVVCLMQNSEVIFAELDRMPEK